MRIPLHDSSITLFSEENDDDDDGDAWNLLLLDLYPPVMLPQKVSYLELPESTFGQYTNCVYVYRTLCYKIENDTQMMMMMTDTWSFGQCCVP